MTQFKLPTQLADHLEQEIYEKLVSAVELRAKEWNGDWAKREEEGKTYHSYTVYRRGREVEEKVNWYKHTNGLLNIVFFQIPNPTYSSGNDYYRPKSCTVNYEACRSNALFQKQHSIGLLENRINSHVSEFDILHELQDGQLHLGKGNLIEGYVDGTTQQGERFRIHTQMMWNYRYGANSANGYLTQYVQFRSDRRGARQEGKTVLQRLTEQEKQAKADAKQAELIAKNEAKWAKFKLLPDQIDRWADKQIKKLTKELTPEAIQKVKEKTERMYYGIKFDKDYYVTNVTKELDEAKHYKKQVQAWLNNEEKVRSIFGLECNNREHFKFMIW